MGDSLAADVMNAVSEACRDVRKDYHITLGELISFLRKVDPDTPVLLPGGGSIWDAGSYRGYFADLAFCASEEPHTAMEVLKEAKKVLNKKLEGYKGGEFLMEADTPLWVAPYGRTGPAIVSIALGAGCVKLWLKDLRE